MGINGLGHIYVETTSWVESVGFWKGLEFAFAEQWGSEGHRAGRLVNNHAVVVLAEVSEDPTMNVFLSATGLDSLPTGPATVTTPLSDTHWGTRWVRVTDPDGRTFALEESP